MMTIESGRCWNKSVDNRYWQKMVGNLNDLKKSQLQIVSQGGQPLQYRLREDVME